MAATPIHYAQLSRMEGARRQTQRQLELIDCQVLRRITSILPQLARRQTGYRRGKAPDTGSFLERYRNNLAALTAERQPEFDALTRKLARQDAAIAAFRKRFEHVGDAAQPRAEV
ncbi:hypothetical protein EXN32_11925 [Agrobacterium tumefaciens]|uniref:Uncharacterized protein n=2 Tax=Rhizobium/Agrobacterium group TaxID=227290 RepID=A0A2Z2PQ20_RHIRH|nr:MULTISPECIES: hypothetical protein [Rhizobium/Agrobacterium group]ASK42979.1 hypothetical protein [Rhizobium rhizogenes]MCZ7977385.1 hypothetical protein [Agrobacterium salinitolerans]MDA5243194.1 hypothetical protein [Agrobacterium sp. MAFF310724]MDA5247624.1 hypothetical protein [Agrobacterium sp. MAFF210268]TRB03291.1 hypothetical protein EXN61_23540 [Agrobacterium tumefaciens]